MTSCVIYCRISRDRTGAGLGVERQEAECRELAARLGMTVAMTYVDNDLSAYSGKPRPGYQRLLADIEAGRIAAVLVWHLDRLHRSPTELESYITASDRCGVPTHSVTAGLLDLSNPDGRMIARITGAVARREVEHSVKRIRSKKDQLAVNGGWAGGRRPFGFEPDGVTVRESEARHIREAMDAVLVGTSLRSEAKRLNAAGVTTSTGRAWNPTELKRVLIRARNAGLREHRGKVIGPAGWKAIVPEERWRAVVALLNDPARRTNTGAARRWLLSGIATCGLEGCGAPLLVAVTHSTRGRRSTYTCSENKHVVRDATELDNLVRFVVVGLLSRPDAVDLLVPARPDVDLVALAAEETNLRERLDSLADDLGLDERTLARRSRALQERLEQIGQEKGAAVLDSPFSGVVGPGIDPAAVWEHLDLDRRRAIVRALMTVEVLPTKRGRPKGWRPGQSYFDPASVRIEPR